MPRRPQAVAAASCWHLLSEAPRQGLQHMQVIRGFQTAAAEMWMLGLTDYQIITTHSGYGRLGSFMSGKFHQVGKNPPVIGHTLPLRYCSWTD